MDTHDETRPAVYEAVRTLLAKKQAGDDEGPKPDPLKTAWKTIPILVFAGAALLLVYAQFRTGAPEAPGDPAAQAVAVPDRSGSLLEETSGVKETPVEHLVAAVPEAETADDSPSRSTDPHLPVETFFVRVGSFREQANAQRVVDSLRVHEPSTTLEISSGGLHSVVVGPFAERSLADNAARTVGQAMGLVPQVLERDAR